MRALDRDRQPQHILVELEKAFYLRPDDRLPFAAGYDELLEYTENR